MHTSYTLGAQFAVYVAYGDTEGLTTEERADFDALESNARVDAPKGHHFAHWSVGDDRDEFARCEATGVHGACLNFDAVYLA